MYCRQIINTPKTKLIKQCTNLSPNFHSHTVRLDIIKVFPFHQLMNKRIALKRILKFTLKQLRHVSV